MNALLARLDDWRGRGEITDAQHSLLSRLVRRERFSLFLELNALIYAGVLAIASGVGWTIAVYAQRLGDAAIVSSLAAVFAACLYYCGAHSPGYSPDRLEQSGLAFDYILYLGCLMFAADLAYVQTRFHIFGASWDHSLLVGAALYFALAYRFDNRFVLSLALATLGGWFGVRVVDWVLFQGSIRVLALTYGGAVAAAGLMLAQRRIKAHFLDTYLHVAVNAALGALVSGTGRTEYAGLYLILLTAAAAVIAYFSVQRRRFAFLVYAIIYAYAGLSARLMAVVNWNKGLLAYFAITGSLVVFGLASIARRFARDE